MPFEIQTVSLSDLDTLKLGYLLRRTRINDGVSQSYIAKTLGLDPSRLAKIERGKVLISDTEKELLFSQFDEIDMSLETAERLKELFLRMIIAWGMCSTEKMHKIYQILIKNSETYRFCSAFEYYDLATLNYEVIHQAVPAEEQQKKLKEIEEYAELLKGELFSYFLVLKGLFYKGEGRKKESMNCMIEASRKLTVSKEFELLNIQSEYYICGEFMCTERFNEAWAISESCHEKLLKHYFIERAVTMDYYRACFLILKGDYFTAGNMLQAVRVFLHIHNEHQYDADLDTAEIISTMLAGNYKDALRFIESVEKPEKEINMYIMGRITVFYVLSMDSPCRETIEACLGNPKTAPSVSRFAEAISLALRDEHLTSLKILEKLICETNQIDIMRSFYIKVCEIIAAKNGLYKEQIRFMEMQQSLFEKENESAQNT